MKKYISPFLMLVLATWVMAPGWAQAGSGFYLSGDLGANLSKGVKFDGASNDVASHCDFNVNTHPDGEQYCGPYDFSYTNEFIPDWAVDFDGGQGILAGAAVGYSFAEQNPNSPLGDLRVEMEYFYRESKHDQSSKVIGLSGATKDKIARNEFAEGPFERLGSITSHNIFGNVYYDFSNTSRFTPYLGIGGGVGFTSADWSSNWTRTSERDDLRAGLSADAMKKRDDALKAETQAEADKLIDVADNLVHLAGGSPEAREYISRLAGSSSNANATLSDTLWGLQILFGVDYAVTEAMSLGLKGRWVKFNSFSDGLVWNPLRSHGPYVGANNTNPVSGNMSTSDIEFFGISLNMKYHF